MLHEGARVTHRVPKLVVWPRTNAAQRGDALRDKAPRASQAGWKAKKGRRDPVELLCDSSAGCVEDLIRIRFGRMSASLFAFYRGSAALMAGDLATTPTSSIRVQACGDAHLMHAGVAPSSELLVSRRQRRAEADARSLHVGGCCRAARGPGVDLSVT